MSYGLQLFDKSGLLSLEVSDRVPLVYASITIANGASTSALGSGSLGGTRPIVWKYYQIPGVNNSGAFNIISELKDMTYEFQDNILRIHPNGWYYQWETWNKLNVTIFVVQY